MNLRWTVSLLAILLVAVGAFSGCGGGGASAPAAFSRQAEPVEGGTLVRLDATACTRLVSSAEGLEVRWDWDGDGEYDTPYSTELQTTHLYTQPGSYPLTLETRDQKGQSKTFRQTVRVVPVLTLKPKQATVSISSTRKFTAEVLGCADASVTWQVTGGAIDSSGLYRAPDQTGVFRLTVASVADPAVTATSTISVKSSEITVVVD